MEKALTKLMVDIKEDNQLPYYPITVTESFQITDGQHRLEAAKRLGTEAGVLPYEGQPQEGEMQKRQQLLASSTLARYETGRHTLGSAAAGYLGSDIAGGLGIPGTGGVDLTGQITTQRQGRYASTLQQLINQWLSKQSLLTN